MSSYFPVGYDAIFKLRVAVWGVIATAKQPVKKGPVFVARRR